MENQDDAAVLRALIEHFDHGGGQIWPKQICSLTGLDEATVQASLKQLDRMGKIEPVTAEETTDVLSVAGVSP